MKLSHLRFRNPYRRRKFLDAPGRVRDNEASFTKGDRMRKSRAVKSSSDSPCGKRQYGKALPRSRSKPPDNAGRCAVVVLIRAGVVGMHEVALHAPGKVLEPELVVDASADIDQQRTIREPAGVPVTDPGHRVHERAPLAHSDRIPRAAHNVIFRFALPVKPRSVGDQAKAREPHEG